MPTTSVNPTNRSSSEYDLDIQADKAAGVQLDERTKTPTETSSNPPGATDTAEDASETRTIADMLRGGTAREILQMLDAGLISAEDLADPSLQAKVQRAMQLESMFQQFQSNVLRLEHDNAMAVIRNIKA